jgi:hypothetical protein
METELKRGPGRPKTIAPTINDIDTMRDDVRHELRESDPQEAARKRTAEILAQGGIDIASVDEFLIPDHLKHPEWTMEWKRWSVYNAEDHGYINQCLQTGWTFVPANRPGFQIFLPRGWKENYVLKKGMVLMERPAEITRMVNNRQEDEANAQVRRKEQQIGEAPPGTLQRTDSAGNNVGSVKRTISGPIPN